MAKKKMEDESEVEVETEAVEDDYVYPYGEHQIHEALVDIDKRLKKLGV